MRKRSWLSLILALIASLSAATRAGGAEAPKAVLVFYSEDRAAPAMVTADQAIRSAFRGHSPQVQVFNEYLDQLRISTESYERGLVAFLREKYKDQKFDLIIAVGAPALHLLNKHGETLYPGAPVVFGGLLRRNAEALSLVPNATGVTVMFEWRSTLNLALSLHPDTRQVVVVAGDSNFDRLYLEDARQDLGQDERVKFTYLVGLRLEELQQQLAHLPRHTIVIHTNFSRDPDGNYFTSPEGLSLLASHSAAPVYGCWGPLLGHGIVGGQLVSMDALASHTAAIGLRILNGEMPGSIPVETMPGAVTFDWRELRRWGISEERLPPGSIVTFRTPSFWDEYTWSILGVISLLILQSALIAGLLINRSKRKRVNKELRESQERYGLATTAGSTGVWDWDLKSGQMYVDPILKSILGYEDHEIRNHIDDLVRFVHPDDGPKMFEQVRAHIAGKTSYYESEHRMLHQDGSVRWFLSRGNVVRDSEGKEIRLVGTDTDITESKRAIEALHQSESRNRAMLTALPDLIFMLARDGVYLDYHARDPDELYVSPERFIGRSIREVLPEELARSFEQCIEETAQSDEPVLLEYSLQRDTEERYYESSMVRVDADRVMCIVRDITERKRAEMRFRRYFELPLIGMAITSPDRRFAEVNQELCDMLGYSMDELTGKSWVEITHPDDVAENVRLLEQTLRGETEGYTMDKRFIHRDGHIVYSSISARCVRRADRTVDHLVLVLQGITERKLAEEALQQTRSELAHVERVMVTGELAATIAHEVNQPLTAMVANANAARRLLANGPAQVDEAREAIDDIVKDAHRASEVVGHIRAMLRKGGHRTEPLSINQVIEEVGAILRNDLVRKMVSLRLELASDLPEVVADRVEIQQVILNLMMNAIQAMTSVGEEDRDLLLRTLNHESESVLVEVRDSGTGIAADKLEQIFEAFYTTKSDGMGMGLSICRTIIEGHRGRLWAKSNEERGATFLFTLPRAAAAGTRAAR